MLHTRDGVTCTVDNALKGILYLVDIRDATQGNHWELSTGKVDVTCQLEEFASTCVLSIDVGSKGCKVISALQDVWALFGALAFEAIARGALLHGGPGERQDRLSAIGEVSVVGGAGQKWGTDGLFGRTVGEAGSHNLLVSQQGLHVGARHDGSADSGDAVGGRVVVRTEADGQRAVGLGSEADVAALVRTGAVAVEASRCRHIVFFVTFRIIAHQGELTVLISVVRVSENHLLLEFREVVGYNVGRCVRSKAERSGHKGRNRKELLHNAII